MEDLKEKRYRLLNLLDRASVRATTWERCLGPGLWRKVKRFLCLPRIYPWHSIKTRLRIRFNIGHQVMMKTFWGYQMLLPSDDVSTFTIYAFGTLGKENEDKMARFLIRNLQSHDIFYNIGANFGFYAFLASEFTEDEIHAFEPLPHAFGFLKHNTNQARILLNNCALSDREGVVSFYPGTVASGGSTMIEAIARTSGWIRPKPMEVISTTIDSYIKTHKAPTILNIDTEGAEQAIINGGRTFFEKEHPTIIMEVWGGDRGKQFSFPAIKALCAFGYKPYKITSEGFLQEVGDALSLINIDKKFNNVVFKK